MLGFHSPIFARAGNFGRRFLVPSLYLEFCSASLRGRPKQLLPLLPVRTAPVARIVAPRAEPVESPAPSAQVAAATATDDATGKSHADHSDCVARADGHRGRQLQPSRLHARSSRKFAAPSRCDQKNSLLLRLKTQ